MDPLTHGVVGAMAAVPFSEPEFRRKAGLIGFGSAMLPDIEALIMVPGDPLFNLEIHRQFTHSLIFIPFGALLAATLFWFVFRKQLSHKKIYSFAIAGYGTHWFMDLVTSYGTEIFWPFVDTRYSLNIVSVVDPVLTSGLLLFAAFALVKNKQTYIFAGGVWLTLLFCHGMVQNNRAERAMKIHAENRGHEIESFVVKPTIGNQLLWRVTYISAERVYTGGVRTGLFSPLKYYNGESAELIHPEKEFTGIQNSRLYDDLLRFSKMSEGYLVRHPEQPEVIGDARYSMLPTSMIPLWGVKVDRSSPASHTEFLYFRDSGEAVRNAFIDMLTGQEMKEDT